MNSLTSILADKLGKDTIDPDQDLFEQGLTSLTILQLIQKVKQQFEVDINIEEFLQRPTLENLSSRIKEALGDQGKPVPADAAVAEQSSAAVVDEVLTKAGALNPEQDLFEQGLTSLTILQLIQKVKEKFGVEINIEEFLKQPTLSNLSGRIKQTLGVTADQGMQPAVENTAKLSPSVMERLVDCVRRCNIDTDLVIDKDLFEQGLTSLTILQLMQKVKDEFAVSVSIEEFLNQPTLSFLGELVGISASPPDAGTPQAASAVEKPEQKLEADKALNILSSKEEKEAFILAGHNFRSQLDQQEVIDGIAFPDGEFDLEYSGKTSQRVFADELVSKTDLMGWLSYLNGHFIDGKYRYLYPSGGGAYAIQTYVEIKPGGVSGISPGIYYYHPVDYKLYKLSEGALPKTTHFFYNRPHHAAAQFCLYFVAEYNGIKPLYNDVSEFLCTVEVGSIIQILRERQAQHGIGSCALASADPEVVKQELQLGESHHPLLSMVCGKSSIPQYVAPRRGAAPAGSGIFEDIAIIGIHGEFPGANDLDEFWDNLLKKEKSFSALPENRGLQFRQDIDEQGQPVQVWGGFLESVYQFDPLFFNIPPVEAKTIDPQERLFLMSVYELLGTSGYLGDKQLELGSDIGVFVGVMWNDMQSISDDLMHGEELLKHGSFSSIANRVSHYFDWTGPSMAIDTSCTSSLTAIYLACQSIQNGDCRSAVAGGVNLVIHPAHIESLQRYQLLANEKESFTFGDQASGWIPGEGVGAVLLKPLSKAQRDQDNVLGVIKGGAIAHGGRTARYGMPSTEKQKLVMAKAIKNSSLTVDVIDYVETAAAGSAMGDASELQAINSVFADKREKVKIGSVKPNIGHQESASGVSQLAKLLLQMRHGILAPVVPYHQLSPLLDQVDNRLEIVAETQPWDGGSEPMTALVNGFGGTGSYASLVIQSRQDESPAVENMSLPGVFVLSARTRMQLREYISRWHTFLQSPTKINAVSLPQVLACVQLGRTQLEERIAFVVDSLEDLKAKISCWLQSGSDDPSLNYVVFSGNAGKQQSTKVEASANYSCSQSVEIARDWVAGVWNSWSAFYTNCAIRKVPLPTLPLQCSEYAVTYSDAASPENTLNAPAATVVMPSAHANTVNLVQREISSVFEIPSSTIQADDSWEDYGVSSLLIVRFTNALEKHFGSLSKTLLFEYQTVADLCEYLAESFPDVAGKTAASATAIALPNSATAGQAKTKYRPVRRHLLSAHDESIAVVGIGGRYPQAESLAEYWDNLRSGKDCISEIPADRWDHGLYFDSDQNKPGKTYGKWGGFLARPDQFNPLFFNISPREAVQMDPQERLFLEVAWEAIEDAGYTRRSLQQNADGQSGKNIGVYVGIMYSEYQLFGAQETICGNPRSVEGNPGSIANRLSYFGNFTGPSMVVDNMCTSSLTAIHLACRSIQQGECDAAIAGGVNLSIHPNKYLGLAQGKFLSDKGLCESFGEGGQGFVPAEGVGAVVLKPMQDAIADRDNIWGIILGSAINHDGKTNGYTVPNPLAQARVIEQAMRNAGIDAAEISYIEAHGTGTKLGDPVEISGLSKAFSKYTDQTQYCAIGSVKSNIGHCESAAGVSGLTKILLQMKHGEIVPSLHSATLNPNIDFARTPFVVNQELRSWERPVVDGEPQRRIAGISSFGAGGANAHMLVAEYIDPLTAEAAVVVSENGKLAVPLSARTEAQLRQKAKDLLEFIRTEDESLDLLSLAYTLQVGREAMGERLGVLVSSLDELSEKLQAYVDNQLPVEGFYQGQVKRNKDTLALFTADADLQDTLQKWINKRHLNKLLDLWVKGLELDWGRLYGEARPRRISLPTYPFAKERYWIDTVASHAASSQSQTAVLHPLLHSNTSSLKQQSYRSVFNGNEPFITDQGLLSSGAYLEMIRAAVEDASEPQETGILELHETVWGALLSVGEERPVNLALLPRGHEVAYEIYSGEDEVVHCQGYAVVSDQPGPGRLALDNVKAGLKQVTPVHPVIHAQHESEHGILAEIRLTDDLTESEYGLHPTVLNAVLTTGASLLGGNTNSGLLASVDKVRLVFGSQSPLLAWIRHAGEGLAIDLCTAEGAICMQLQGVRYAALQQAVEPVSKPVAEAVRPVELSVPASSGLSLSEPSELSVGTEVKSKPQGISLATPAELVLTDGQDADTRAIRLSDVNAPVSLAAEGSAALSVLSYGEGLYEITLPGGELSEGLVAELLEALSVVGSATDTKVLVLKSASRLYGERSSYNHALPLYEALAGFAYPVIAALEWGAVGSGFLLASLCDFMVCSESGDYGYRVGDIFPSAAEEQLFKQRFGTVLSDDLLYQSGELSGSELRSRGWMCRIEAASLVESVAQELARELTGKPQKALRLLKGHLGRELLAGVELLHPVEGLLQEGVADFPTEPELVHAAIKLSLSHPAPGVLQIRLCRFKADYALASLVSDLGEVLEQAVSSGIYRAVLLSSDYEDFLPVLSGESSTVLDLLGLIRGTGLPVIALLEGNARGIGWLLAQGCDGCVYHRDGVYGLGDSLGEGELLGVGDELFGRRMGSALGQEVLLTGAEYRGEELGGRCGVLRVSEDVLLGSLDLARVWDSVPLSQLAEWKLRQPELLSGWELVESGPERMWSEDIEEVELATEVMKAEVHPEGILVVRMEDREAKNMFSEAFIEGIGEVFAHIARVGGYKVVILTGYENYFASGGTKSDLLEIQEGKAKFTDTKIYQLAMDCDVPVIAAMQGHGIGAGWALGMFADFVLLSEGSRYVSPYMNYGFTPGAGSTLVFPRKIGYDLSRETLLTGLEYAGGVLRERGLPWPVLNRSEVVSSAFTLARSLALHQRSSLMALKQRWRQPLADALETFYAQELAMHEATFVGQAEALSRIQDNFSAMNESQSSTDQSLPISSVSDDSKPVVRSEIAQFDLAEIKASLKILLADELYLQEHDIDEDMQFVDLGLDSITGVTWIRKINQRYQLDIEATKVYSYPTLVELSQYVKTEVERTDNASPDAAPVSLAMPPASETTLSQGEYSLVSVVENLKALLAKELYLAEEDIDEDIQFVDLGLDSITGVTWIRNINEYYGTAIEATKVYSYPTLNTLSSYVKAEAEQGQTLPKSVLPVSASGTESSPAQVSGTVELSSIEATLKSLLAQELYLQEQDIDEDAQFVDLGLDSITGVTWIRNINEHYGVSIEATKVYAFPTLKLLTDYVGQQISHEKPPATQPAVTVKPLKQIPEVVASPQALVSWRDRSGRQPVTVGRTAAAHERVAVIGMAGQFPQANNLDEFWRNIASGEDCISEVSAHRWNTAEYYQAGDVVAGKTNSKWVGALTEYDQFDPLFFSISPTEAESMDPQQRLFLQACWHGIEDAGYSAASLSGSKCGVFVGCSHGEYHLLSREQQISAHGFTGEATSILAARISYLLNLQGPCLSIDTACSSSLVAISSACDSLVAGGSDLALAGGVYVMSGPELHIKTSQSGMLSADGRCFTFDQRANGIVLGEGVGAVLLKRLSDAQRDDDRIYAVIQGWGVNQDGKTNGITAPNAQSQSRLQKDIYQQFQIDPADIQLVEAHGTGTKLGDPIEVEGLKQSFRSYTQDRSYCALGSVKSNIGHCVTAAGVAGFVKAVLALQHRQLPPTINYQQPNEHLGLDGSPFYVNDQLREWDSKAGVARQAAVSSFGFSGTNAHLVLAEYAGASASRPSVEALSENGQVMIPLSAQTEDQLIQKARDMLAFLQNKETTVNLLELAYTLQIGRDAMEERLGFLTDSVAVLCNRLNAYLEGEGDTAGIYKKPVKRDKESMRLISQDADMKEAIVERLVGERKLGKLLGLWVKGLELDWARLYGEQKPRRISLPLYPFAKERYWIDSVRDNSAARSEKTSAALHPLVHTNTSSLEQQSYRSVFTGQEFFLTDHQVRDPDGEARKVLPGVAYLEMVRAAVADATDFSDQVMELSNTVWVRPLFVAAQQTADIVLLPHDDGSIDCEIRSLEGSEEVVHCQTGVALIPHVNPAKLNLDELLKQMRRGSLEAADIYAAFNQMGLYYGTAHQAITVVHQGIDQALAELKAPTSDQSGHAGYVLHPGLLDSALQASIGLSNLDELGRQPSLPFALESLRLISACTSDMFAWVRYAGSNPSNGKVSKLDIDLCDRDGNICVQIKGFSFRVLESAEHISAGEVTGVAEYRRDNENQNGVAFDDAFYEELIESVANNEITVDEAVRLG